MTEKLYAERSIEELWPHYIKHVSAMTGEALHDKGAIAAELAWRDAEIDRLRADNATLRTALQNHGEEAARMVAGDPVGYGYRDKYGELCLLDEPIDDDLIDRMHAFPLCTASPAVPAGWQLVSVADIDELVGALQGVLRVADRQTTEFDAARYAIAKHTTKP